MADNTKSNGPWRPDQSAYPGLDRDYLCSEPGFWFSLGQILPDPAVVPPEDWKARLHANLASFLMAQRM